MKRIILIIFSLVMFFVGFNSFYAASVSDYEVGKYIYYDPVKNKACADDNYWTFYNQKSTCYRWAIVATNSDLNYIRVIIDHDIGVSTFNDRNKVIQAAIDSWNITPLSDSVKASLGTTEANAQGSLGTKVVLTLYKGNAGFDREYYMINSEWSESDPTANPYYKKISPNTTRFLYSNVKLGHNNKSYYDYNYDNSNYSYQFSDVKHNTSGGFWLSDTIGTNPFVNNSSEFSKYAFYMDASGFLSLALKTELKGVRPVISIDISVLEENVFSATEFNLFDKTLVGDATSSTVSIGEAGQTLKTNTKYHPQGFTVIGNNQGLFYMAPVGGLDEHVDNGIIIYNNGGTFKQVYKGVFGHGNDLAYNKQNSLLYIARSTLTDSGSRTYNYVTTSFNTSTITLGTNLTHLSYGASTITIDDLGKYYFYINGDRRIYVRRLSDNKTMYYFDTSLHGTIQGLQYVNGYLYISSYESCGIKYQSYCYGKKDALMIDIYNVKFNPDGTPNRWFGQHVKSYYADDMTGNSTKRYELEGVGAYNEEIYMGLARKNYTSSGSLISYVPAIYSYKEKFHTVTYKLGNATHSERIFNNKFPDMGLFLNNKNYSNGFVGWLAPSGTVYNDPKGASIRIKEDTTFNGVYIEPNSNYTFVNDGLNISYRAKVSNVLNDIKVYNGVLKIYRNGTEITTSTNEYIKYGDVLKIVVNDKEYKSYNLYPQKYLVTFSNGTSNTTGEYLIGSEVTFVNNISKTGYTLTGFSYNGNNYNLIDKITMPTNDITLEAIWTANSYTLSYDAVTTTKTITYDSVYGELPTPTKEGYTFKGWYLENTYNTPVTSATKVTTANNHKLYAKWQANSYTLSYDAATTTKTITYDSVYGELLVPTKTGYAFKGWYLENTYKTLITKDTKVTRNYNHMLYGKWELIKPDITKTSDYKVKNGMVSNVKLKAEVKDLNLGLESYYKVKVQDKNKKDKTTGKMATNDKVQIYLDNTLVDEYTVVIKGDVTGTGEASVSDVAKLYQHLKKKITMEDCYIEAGNVYSDDNEIKINDVAKLYQFIKGKIKTLD